MILTEGLLVWIQDDVDAETEVDKSDKGWVRVEIAIDVLEYASANVIGLDRFFLDLGHAVAKI
eukprot:7791127-Pyramimonas_sp.AAC.1